MHGSAIAWRGESHSTTALPLSLKAARGNTAAGRTPSARHEGGHCPPYGNSRRSP